MDKPFNEVVNTALCSGLANFHSAPGPIVTVRPPDFGATRAGVDINRLNQKADEMAVKAGVHKAEQAISRR